MTNPRHWREHDMPVNPDTLSRTYEEAAQWLAPCSTVEDWGCGMAWPARSGLINPLQYTGIDFADNAMADEIEDLTEYQSDVEGILLRHVLEHNYKWRNILDNAARSFTKRLALVLFTPFQDTTRILDEEPDGPLIGFNLEDLTARLVREGAVVHIYRYETVSQFGEEHILKAEKP